MVPVLPFKGLSRKNLLLFCHFIFSEYLQWCALNCFFISCLAISHNIPQEGSGPTKGFLTAYFQRVFAISLLTAFEWPRTQTFKQSTTMSEATSALSSASATAFGYGRDTFAFVNPIL